MEKLYELKDLLCDELEKVAEKGELTAGSLETVEKLTHSLKSLLAIMEMEGESFANGRNYMGNYGGNFRTSYARGRGRGYSRRGYSRDGDLTDRLMDIMADVDDPKVKQSIRKVIEKMED